MTQINYPSPDASPWVDEYQQTWAWNGKTWVRFNETKDRLGEAPTVPEGIQHVRQDGEWVPAPVSERYLGAHPNHPILRNDDDYLEQGDNYFNSVFKEMLVWKGNRWGTYNKLIEIIGITHYVWKAHVFIPQGGTVTPTDSYGNTLTAPWIKGQHAVLMYSAGLNLIEEVDSSLVLGNYTVDYNNAVITIVNQDLLAGDIIVELIDTALRQPKIFPYFATLYQANYYPANIDDPIIEAAVVINATNPDPDSPGDTLQIEEDIFWIIGGNFDLTTRLHCTNSAVVLYAYLHKSDQNFYCKAHNVTLLQPTDRFYLTNGTNRESYGPEILAGNLTPTQPENPGQVTNP